MCARRNRDLYGGRIGLHRVERRRRVPKRAPELHGRVRCREVYLQRRPYVRRRIELLHEQQYARLLQTGRAGLLVRAARRNLHRRPMLRRTGIGSMLHKLLHQRCGHVRSEHDHHHM